jgi:hypothetical protein
MTKRQFIDMLEDKDIIWNNLVNLIVINPHYVERRWFEFWKPNIPKTIKFYGALGFCLPDKYVGLMVQDETNERVCLDCFQMRFDFKEIVGIEKIKD